MQLVGCNRYINANRKREDIDFDVIYGIIKNCKDEITQEQIGRYNTVISWLPSIKEIEINMSYDDRWLVITFYNNEQIRMFDTGVEDALDDYIEYKGDE